MTQTLKEYHPLIFQELHPSKNEGPLDTISVGSNKKLWWLGHTCNHDWDATIKSRVKGSGCPYCSGNRFAVGINDFATKEPVLAQEWHPTKNGNLTPNSIMSGYTKKVWWLCSKKHAWEMSVINRTRHGKNCPKCNPRKNAKQKDSLRQTTTKNPELLRFLHPTKNGNPQPELLEFKETYWWLCPFNHAWTAKPRTLLSHKNSFCPACAGREVDLSTHSLTKTHPQIAAQWHPTQNLPLTPDMVTHGSSKKATWLCDEKSHEWNAFIYARTGSNPSQCPKCSISQPTSQAEQEISDYIQNTLGLDILKNDRSLLNGKELDIYIPSLRIAIEFNGLHWHQENRVGKLYHHEKYLLAQKAEIRLIQIWEDDWNRRSEIIKKALASKLGESKSPKIYARKTTPVKLSFQEAAPFLDQYHVQGRVQGSYYLGLNDEDNALQAVMVLKKERNNTLNIVRYATAYSVVGGFTKILKYAEKAYAPDAFITFADLTISDGKLYSENGFAVDLILPPDYMYIVNKQRVHKFNYRLKRFREDPNLIWDENLSERELAQLNNIPRIWDAGKIRFRKQIV